MQNPRAVADLLVGKAAVDEVGVELFDVHAVNPVRLGALAATRSPEVMPAELSAASGSSQALGVSREPLRGRERVRLPNACADYARVIRRTFATARARIATVRHDRPGAALSRADGTWYPAIVA